MSSFENIYYRISSQFSEQQGSSSMDTHNTLINSQNTLPSHQLYINIGLRFD